MKLNRMLSVFSLVALLCRQRLIRRRWTPYLRQIRRSEGQHRNRDAHVENGKSILRVSADFKVPDTPAPTWRVVDSKGNIYTLDAFKIKAGRRKAGSRGACVRP